MSDVEYEYFEGRSDAETAGDSSDEERDMITCVVSSEDMDICDSQELEADEAAATAAAAAEATAASRDNEAGGVSSAAESDNEVEDDENVAVKKKELITHQQLHGRFNRHIGRNFDLLRQNPDKLRSGIEYILTLIGRKVYRGGSALRYQRFATRMALLVRAMNSRYKDTVRTRQLLFEIRRFFIAPETEKLLTRAKWDETFAPLVRLTDAENMESLQEELSSLTRYLEGVRSVESDEQTFQKYVYDVGKFERVMRSRKYPSVRQAKKQIRKINAYMQHRTTKAELYARYYLAMSTARVVNKSLVEWALHYATKRSIPYEEPDGLRFRRFVDRAEYYLRELYAKHSCARSANLLWTMQRYFEPIRGLPVLDRRTLLDKFGHLTAMISGPRGDTYGKLDAISAYISELQIFLEGVESLADDIDRDDFERFLEELGLLRDTVPYRRSFWPGLIVLRIDSMRDLFNPDRPEEPFDDAAIAAALADEDGKITSAGDWDTAPITADIESLSRFEKAVALYGGIAGEQPKKVFLRRMAEMLTMLETLKSTEGYLPILRNQRLARRVRSLREGYAWHSGWLDGKFMGDFFNQTTIENVMTASNLNDCFRNLLANLETYDEGDDTRMRVQAYNLFRKFDVVDRLEGICPEKFEKLVIESCLLREALGLRVAKPIIARQLEYMRPLMTMV
jgi:hypothetical protein